jgi:ABC-2 type transport system permease protein
MAVAVSPELRDLADGVRVYWEIARRGYRRYATYRAATLAGIFTNSVFGLMRAYILIALFNTRPHVGNYTVADAVTYTWLTQAAIMIVYLWGWYDIAERIRSGDIVTDLQRPVDFQLYWLSQDLGRALYHGLFRGIPPFLLGMLFFHLLIPTDPLTYLMFVLSMGLGVCISFGMRFITNLAAFWILDYRGVGTLATTFWTFLSGFGVPLAIFPGALRTVCQNLPFAGMIQIPVDVFLGKYSGLSLLVAMGKQVGWAAVLLLIGRLMLKRAERRVVVQGG